MEANVNPAPSFPNYHKPGIPVADAAFHKPMYKAMKMLMKRPSIRRTVHRGRGILISPDVHVAKKKVKWY